MRLFFLLSALVAATLGASQNSTGEAICVEYMCVSGTVSGTQVQYVLQSTGKATVGWMAIGFGTQMADTPMVIMWPNSDGSYTLSQRMASGEVMPTVVDSPPRTASIDQALSINNGTNPRLAFTIPANSDTQQQLIWAFGLTNPDNSAVDANLQQHITSGNFVLDLTQDINSSNTSYIDNPALGGSSGDSSGGSSGGPSSSVSIPLAPYEKLIVAHAVLMVVGFLFLLPAGALLARYLRTFTRSWFIGHATLQLALAGPVIIAGVVLGVMSVMEAGSLHLDDTHKKFGLALFILYFVQISLGTIIHYFKPSQRRAPARPLQNYAHAVLGLLIIALAFYQVHTGYRDEWSKSTGRPALPEAVNSAWMAWVVIVPVLYALGIIFLGRQIKQERAAAANALYYEKTKLASGSDVLLQQHHP